ncbi:hypothetical protein IE4872_CH02486 [Rhizobium gallicum]|uniref:DUF2946 domain-containing protein n=1 Tax=Rhizobium gallicum TaxID=56730 RepID=A0A1L5NJL6_9HYPH|nr:hypothetical protein IE4872_CH02486 [Rhizobium gallicum]
MASWRKFCRLAVILLVAMILINLPGRLANAGDEGCISLRVPAGHSQSHQLDRLPGVCCVSMHCCSIMPALPIAAQPLSEPLVVRPTVVSSSPLLLIRPIDPPPKTTGV